MQKELPYQQAYFYPARCCTIAEISTLVTASVIGNIAEQQNNYSLVVVIHREGLVRFSAKTATV
jgi:hypothetical protein